jgi:chemotaxis protein CheX
MDVKYINPFVVATKTVFKTMLNIDMDIDKPVLRTENITSGDITGIMGLVGDKEGSISMSFKEKGALFIYKKLMDDDQDSLGPEVVDSIGELTNIISGQARKELQNAGITLKSSIPTVVVGKGIQLHFISKLPMVSLPFSFSTGDERETLEVGFSFG